jgi:dTDP-4-amino-4,6-dideoxygalactose transaminase
MVGSFGDVAAFSFCQDKIMTTGGEGGMVTTNSKNLWKKIGAYKDHGKDPTLRHAATSNDSAVFMWQHDSFGSNFRMTEMQAAIGRLQLKSLPEWLRIRQRNANILTDKLQGLDGVCIALPPEYIEHAYYKYYVFINGDQRDALATQIIAKGIKEVGSGSCAEIYLEQAFKARELVPQKRLAVAKRLGETSLMFQVDPSLSVADMHDIADIVHGILK